MARYLVGEDGSILNLDNTTYLHILEAVGTYHLVAETVAGQQIVLLSEIAPEDRDAVLTTLYTWIDGAVVFGANSTRLNLGVVKGRLSSSASTERRSLREPPGPS